eukprot:Opistho-2@49486
MVRRKENGAPQADDFERAAFVARFDPVRQHLNKFSKKYIPSEGITNKYLAKLTQGLLQYQEDHFGRNSTAPPMTKVPAKLFLDFSAGGGLCVVLSTALRFRSEHNLPALNLQGKNPEQYAQLFKEIENAVQDAKLYSFPRVFFAPSISDVDAKRLGEIIKRRQGNVTRDKAAATHVVHASAAGTFGDEEYYRAIGSCGEFVLVHFWYTPDSYDVWLPEDETEDPELDPVHEGAWNVAERWIEDTDKYNEWMNEEDYELSSLDIARAGEAQGTEQRAGRAGRGGKRSGKATAETERGASAKRARKSESPEPERSVKRAKTAEEKGKEAEEKEKAPDVPAVPHVKKTSVEQITPASKPANPEAAPIKGGTILNISNSAGAPLDAEVEKAADATTDVLMGEADAARTEIESGKEVPNEGEDALDDLEGEDVLAHQTVAVVVPSHAAWFDYNAIHHIEKRALPEFFNGKNRSKTPEIYMAYRNFMIDAHRLNPTEYLTATACRRNLAGDVCAIVRVHAFLEQWGLINYQVDPETRPSPMGPPSTSHFAITYDTPLGLRPAIAPVLSQATGNSLTWAETKRVTSTSTAAAQPSQLLFQAHQAPARAGAPLGAPKVAGSKCFSCGGQCGGGYYKSSDYALCASCYLQGRFPVDRPSTDFVKVGSSDDSRADWTEAETLRLLEAIESHKDDWNKVAEHVGSRTQEECILRFLRMPIEDTFLELDGGLALESVPVPFSKANNPLMSTIAFLASAVEPSVAAAAAKAALGAFFGDAAKDPSEAKVDAKVANALESQPEPRATEETVNSASTAMEVDGTPAETAAVSEGAAVHMSEPSEGNIAHSADKAESAIEIDQNVVAVQPTESASEIAKKAVDEKTSQRGNFGNYASAAAAALSSAAVKAKVIAINEERHAAGLVSQLVECQLRKLEIKLRHFDELEAMLHKEREQLEQQRQQLYTERLQFQAQKLQSD